MTKKILFLILLTATLFVGCKSDDDDEITPVTEIPKGPNIQAMIVFAPGQLGDNSYADCVMKGIHGLEELSKSTFADSLNVDFIAESNFELTKASLKAWAANTRNPIYGNEYKRRILIFTESYMMEWLTDIKDQLQENDEVLALKVNEAELIAVERLGMTNRIHGLNISAADAARKYCTFINSKMEENRWKLDELGDVMQVWMFQLYPDYQMAYRDSVYEVFSEELLSTGDIDLFFSPISSLETEGKMSAVNPEESAMQASFDAAESMVTYSMLGFGFCYVDLGAANLGYDYFLLNQGRDDFYTLMLDGKPNLLGRFVVQRYFDKAIVEWVRQWLLQSKGSMPTMTTHGQWDGYCTNTVPEV
ncbi:MAG: hypothetical protein K5683_10515 [Prevotella sp.]|nr:hypothetical protein [Prevotella sp.]